MKSRRLSKKTGDIGEMAASANGLENENGGGQRLAAASQHRRRIGLTQRWRRRRRTTRDAAADSVEHHRETASLSSGDAAARQRRSAALSRIAPRIAAASWRSAIVTAACAVWRKRSIAGIGGDSSVMAGAHYA
jgi:hypothetical protein